MISLLIAVFVYACVYTADYLFYMKQGEKYAYVSRRTYALLILGQLTLILLFFPYYKLFFEHIGTEIAMIGVFLAVMLGVTSLFHVNHHLICHGISRTERCLTPGYVAVRGADILFQQLAYLVIALVIKDMFGLSLSSYLLFTVILVIIHTPVVLSSNKMWFYLLTVGMAILSVPFFYIYSHLELFWPAIYVHSLVYVFMWLTFADMEGTDQKGG